MSTSLHRRIEPARLLADLNISAKVGWSLFLVTLLALVLCLVMMLRPVKVRLDKVFLVAADGTPHLVVPTEVGAVTNLHVWIADQATLVLLLRNPNGFDHADKLDIYFAPAAAAQARGECERDREERQARHLQQKPVVVNVEHVRLSDGRVRVLVRGQLVSMGLLGDQSVLDATVFQLDLELTVNPNLASNGLVPMVVRSYQYETVRR